MAKIALRGYTRKTGRPQDAYFPKRPDPPLRHRRVLVFDTETTTDQYQNLKIAFFQIYQDEVLQHEGLFHDLAMLSERETKTLTAYAKKHNIALYSSAEFVDGVFYPEVYEMRALCVGFNLPFDLSRIATRAGDSRKANKGGFTFKLSENKFNPPVIVKKLGLAYSFKLTTTKQNCKEDYFPGYFLDAQQLAEVLLQRRRISLAKAGEQLNTTARKMKDIEHGTVTKRYIEYLIRDVETTFEVYRKLVAELDLYQIDIPLTRIFSAASIGKHALRQLGIKPFLELNPDFSPDIFGHLMSAYYGGRTECRIRKQPEKVTALDFTSMYPTVTMQLDLWPYVTAQSLDVVDATEEARSLLASVDLDYLRDSARWKGFVTLVKIRPDEDILPTRMDYKGKGAAFNVGVNYLSSDTPLWYALPDVIASVLLTGKVPEVVEAIRFVPMGRQDGLRPSAILGVEVDPSEDNLVQVLVEERQKIKQRLKAMGRDDPEYQHLESRAQAMKILVNAMSYGIFIELNPEDKKSQMEVYGLESFTTEENRYERAGTYYNPLLAVMITAGSRLFLAMAEAKVRELGGQHAYMDTDSIYIPPEYAETLVDYFQPLNPYTRDLPLLKPEKEDVWFYGISSKRYALYQYETGKIELVDYKLHGLGHLTNPFPINTEDWQGEIWRDILRMHYGHLAASDIEEKYGALYAIARLTVSTSNVLKRFKGLNKDQDWPHQIKPFNFFHVGFQAVEDGGRAVKPLSPYQKDTQSIVHRPFIDYETGRIMEGIHYFKPLSRTILDYMDHPEHKFEGDCGLLERSHVKVDGLLYIGKEANNIDEQAVDVKRPQVFVNMEEVKERILKMSLKEGEALGINRGTLWRMKKKCKICIKPIWNKNNIKKLYISKI